MEMSESNSSRTRDRQTTPSVPAHDWNIENYEMEISVQEPKGMSSHMKPHDVIQDNNYSNKVSVISTVSSQLSNAASNNIAQTPAQYGTSNSSLSTPIPSMSNRIAGDVTLTPNHSAFTPQSVNPHSSMTALTPMVSGTNQARNSIRVQNCVSTVHLGCELKLLDIYCRTRFSEYNPARFHGVVMKIIDPRATALVFRSGKVLCTGLRNEHDSYIAARKFARIIQKLGYPAKFLDFKIQNFIATADLRFPIRLEALQQAHGQFASYEPELFPGLVYRMVRPRVVLLIFVNGKIVFTGGKTRNEIHEALDIIYPILRSYRIS
ncbi:uncharacterized protein LOC142975665 [Anticarsia gemmatalis]|uniref:uncharacterized protein LOC142975665 n=1 Tax=Anticarsia gemmatalis TaxID=129554 RepID=UPI003F76BE0B